MTAYPIQPKRKEKLPYLSANDEMSESINNSINDLSQDVGLFTRMRLQRVRGREAVKLSETALAEYMAAKRRAFVYQVGLAEDHAKKLMLSDSMQQTAVIEREIARIISEAVSNFENLIMGHEEAAYRSELELTHNAESLLKVGKISERRCQQMIENIEASTDKIVETVQRTTREILTNLEHRFHQALKHG